MPILFSLAHLSLYEYHIPWYSLRTIILEVCNLLKQALDVLKKAENDAELTVASAKKRSAEIRKRSEEEKAELINKSIAAAKAEAIAVASRYEAEVDFDKGRF